MLWEQGPGLQLERLGSQGSVRGKGQENEGIHCSVRRREREKRAASTVRYFTKDGTNCTVVLSICQLMAALYPNNPLCRRDQLHLFCLGGHCPVSFPREQPQNTTLLLRTSNFRCCPEVNVVCAAELSSSCQVAAAAAAENTSKFH